MTRWGMIAAWVVVAVAATTATWTVLSSADRQTGDAPAALPVPVTSATTSPPGSAVAPSDSPSTSSTTSLSPSTTVTTTDPAGDDWTSLTVPSGGGVVVVSHRPGEVRLESATPAPGYAMEIDDRGPDEARVEFAGADDEYEIRVRWHNGALDVEVDGA